VLRINRATVIGPCQLLRCSSAVRSSARRRRHVTGDSARSGPGDCTTRGARCAARHRKRMGHLSRAVLRLPSQRIPLMGLPPRGRSGR